MLKACRSCKPGEGSCGPLLNILPRGYKYCVCKLNPYETGFETEFHAQLFTKEEADLWKTAFEESSLVTFRVNKTFPNVGQRVLYKISLHCQHNKSRVKTGSSKETKKTNCIASLTITIANVFGFKRNNDSHFPEWPAKLKLRWTHNHPIDSASALRYRDISANVKERLIQFFHEGNKAAKAHNLLRAELQIEKGDDYATASGDRQILPSKQDVQRLYRSSVSKKYNDYMGPFSYEKIIGHIKEMHEDVKVEGVVENGHLVIAMTTQLMERVHRLVPNSGDIVFFDSNCGIDRHDMKVFLLLTHSPVGGLPLGCFMTNSESAQAIESGLRLLLELLPSTSFNARGHRGPQVFMTNNSEAEKLALSAVFPESSQLLCGFHILHACWKNLLDTATGVFLESMPHLLNLLKGMLNALTADDLNEKFGAMLTDDILMKYPGVMSSFLRYWDIRDQWAIALRSESERFLMVRGYSTTNVLEGSFLTLSENILLRQKTNNIFQLVDYLTSHLNSFYCRRIMNVIGQMDVVGDSIASQKASTKLYCSGFDIERLGTSDDIFTVRNDDSVFAVNTSLGICTCPYGNTGAACKHQFAVKNNFFLGILQSPPVSTDPERLRYLEVATGSKDAPASWTQLLCVLPLSGISSRETDFSVQQVGEVCENMNIVDTGNEEEEVEDMKVESDLTEDNKMNAICFTEFKDVCCNIERMVSNDQQTLLGPFVKFLERLKKSMATSNSLATCLASFCSKQTKSKSGKHTPKRLR